jgi:hypothetical protein
MKEEKIVIKMLQQFIAVQKCLFAGFEFVAMKDETEGARGG